MVRVFRWDGKELFINPDHVSLVELREGFGEKDTTEVTLINGKTHSLSAPSYDILTGHTGTKKGPGRAGFDVL